MVRFSQGQGQAGSGSGSGSGRVKVRQGQGQAGSGRSLGPPTGRPSSTFRPAEGVTALQRHLIDAREKTFRTSKQVPNHWEDAIRSFGIAPNGGKTPVGRLVQGSNSGRRPFERQNRRPSGGRTGVQGRPRSSAGGGTPVGSQDRRPCGCGLAFRKRPRSSAPGWTRV